MDWSKESSKTNFCGWCKGGVIDPTCDGMCFTDQVQYPLLNKCTHLESEIEIINKRLVELRVEKKKVKEEINIIYGKRTTKTFRDL